MIDEQKLAEQTLIGDFERWEHLYVHGGQDPCWEDGCNLNLVRNHIIRDKERLEELKYFPEIYTRETPPKVDNKYMARADEIRERAKQSLTIYLADENYQFLLKNRGQIDKKAADSICLGNVIGYVEGLKQFIEKDLLVGMRRHERADIYQESFKRCREKMEKLMNKPKPEKLGQMNIFDFI